MTPTATRPTTPSVRIVWPKDTYDTRRCSGRCRQPLRDLDVIATTATSAHHIQCAPSSLALTPATPTTPTTIEQCWYAAGTPAACPFPVALHNLCTDHHGQLCSDGKKPKGR